jgi:hypothetical protein
VTNQEIKALAREWCEGRILFSTQVPKEIISMVFMPIIFLNEEQRQELIAENVFAFYGKMADAGPRGINGYPIFWTMYRISEDDYNKLRQYAKEYSDIMQKVFGEQA